MAGINTPVAYPSTDYAHQAELVAVPGHQACDAGCAKEGHPPEAVEERRGAPARAEVGNSAASLVPLALFLPSFGMPSGRPEVGDREPGFRQLSTPIILAMVEVGRSAARAPGCICPPFGHEPDFAAPSVNWDLDELLARGRIRHE